MLSVQTMEFWPYFYKHWNYGLISPNILILALFLETLEFWPHPSKQCNSGPIFLKNIGILVLFWYTLV